MSKRVMAAGAAAVLFGAAALMGCSPVAGGDQTQRSSDDPTSTSTQPPGPMDHKMDGGPVPAGMIAAKDPAYSPGDQVRLQVDHMPGMQGALATVVGAYDTYTYAIDYTPTNGGAPVQDHRWVVQEELSDVGAKRLPDGATAKVTADHMPGMKDATATIASSTDETVYVVDYEVDGMKMTNHMWVVDSEVEPVS